MLLLSLTGLLTGILQAYDEFTMPAIAPAVWNVVIIVLLVVLHTHFRTPDQVYAYAIAWLVATVVQMVLVASALRKIDFRIGLSFSWRDPRVRQVLILFFPVTMSVGIINLDAFLNAELGTLVSSHAPIAINDAFRLYMLPQGVFSVAVTTVLFPSLARMANARDAGGMRATIGQGIRQINLLLIPSAALRRCSRHRSSASSTSTGPSGRCPPSGSPSRSSGLRSRCRSPASTCCSPGRSSRCSARGSRPAGRRST